MNTFANTPIRNSAYEVPPFRRKALFEALEPRLLLSADLLPGGTPAVVVAASAAAEPSVELSPQASESATPLQLSPVGPLEGGVRLSQTESGSTSGHWNDLPFEHEFSVDLAAGQRLSVAGMLDAGESNDYYGVVLTLLDPEGNEVGSADGNQRALLQTLAAPMDGSYSVLLRLEFRAEPGEYSPPESIAWELVATIDAAIEQEAIGDGSNSWLGDAQALDDFRPLPLGGASRTAVVGVLERAAGNGSDADTYRIDLGAGETLEVETTLSNQYGYLQLLNDQGQVVAAAVRTGESMAWEGPIGLPRFVSEVDATYFLRLETWWDETPGLPPLEYTLVVARNASLDPDSHERLGETGVQLVGFQTPPVEASASGELAPASTQIGNQHQYLALAQSDSVLIDLAPIADAGNLGGLWADLRVEDADSGETLLLSEQAPPEGQAGRRFSVATEVGQRLRIVLEAYDNGQLLMQVQGAAGENPLPEVLYSSLDDGRVAASSPWQWLTLSEPVLADRLGAPRLLDGEGLQIGTALLQIYSQGDSLSLRLPDNLPAGDYTLVFDDGMLSDLSGQPLPGFEYSFSVDDQRPQLLSPSLATPLELQPVDQSITLQFDEAMNTAYWPNPSFTDAQGQPMELGWSHAWSADGTQLTLHLQGELPEGQFTMSLDEWVLQDLAGNTLDADPLSAGVQPLQLRLSVDREVYAMPALAEREPFGALVYASSVNAVINGGTGSDDVDEFTIELQAGMRITPVLSAALGQAVSTLPRLGVVLVDPEGVERAWGETTAPGRALLLDEFVVPQTGTWRLRVSSPDGGSGAYQASIIVGAALQREFTELNGQLQPSNGSRAQAEDLEPSSRSLAEGIDRLASVGRFSPSFHPDTGALQSDLDFFSFTLEAGQTASIVLAIQGTTPVSNLRMALFDDSGDWASSAGQLVAAAISSQSADRIILDYTNHGDSAVTLFARPRADSSASYTLVVTRGAGFDVGATDGVPQALGPTGAVLGAIDGSSATVAGGVGPISGSPASQMDVYDGNGFYWDIESDGSVNNGTSDAYDGGLYLSLQENGSDQGFDYENGTRANASQTLALSDDTGNDLRLDRRIFVPTNDGFARYLDQVTNTGSSSRTLTLTLATNLGSDSGTQLIATDAGDLGYDAADHWLITDDADGMYDPSMAHVVWGDGGQAPDSASLSRDNMQQRWTVTLAPGQTVGLLHFAVQAQNQATARATAERLVQLPAEALAGLSPAELASIVNFNTAAGDAYRFWAQAGDELALSVQALVDGGLPFTLRLVAPDGSVRLDTGTPSGALAGLSTGLTVDLAGEWTVQVYGGQSRGEYLLLLQGATGTAPAPQVVAVSPTADQPVAATPAYIDVSFDSFIRSDSAQAEDLALDASATAAGVAVSSVEVRSGKTLRFHLNGVQQPEGLVGWSIADGALMGHDGQGNQAADGSFFIDRTAPVVLGGSSGSQRAPLQQLQFVLSEAMATAGLDLDDILSFTGPLGEDLRNQIYAVEADGDLLTVRFYNQSALGLYSMTLAGSVTDRAGNALDQDGDGQFGELQDDSFSISVEVTQVDLVAGSLTLPESMTTGQQVQLSWVITNQGNSPLPADSSWYDRVWLESEDGTVQVHLGDFSRYQYEPLPSGESVLISQWITVPQNANLASGNYRLRVQADIYGYIAESNDNNNGALSEASTALTVLRPDMVVRDLVVPAQVQGGQNFEVRWTDFNQGDANASSPYGYYYARIELLDSSDGVVGSWSQYYYTDGPIEAGTGEARSYWLTVPSDRPEGEYRVRVTTDLYNYIVEPGAEDNNSSVSEPIAVSQVDLVPVSVTTSASSVDMGASLTISWEVRNDGSATTEGSSWYDLVLLIDPTTGQEAWSSYVSVTPTLVSGASYSQSYTFNVPMSAALARGDYIVRVIADGWGYRTEGNESNNTRDAEQLLHIVPASVADLVVTEVTPGVASIAANLELALSWTVANQGDAASGYFYDRIFLVNEAGSATYLGEIYQNAGLAAGASITRETTVHVPHTLPVGNYRVRVVSDWYDHVEEFNDENNNTGESTPISVTTAIVADLRIDSVTPPASITLGQPITVAWTGSNQGTGDIPAGSGWYERVELLRASNNAVAFTTYVWVTPSGGVPAGGGSYSGSLTFTPPLDAANLPEGDYRIRVTADQYYNYVRESDENNNSLTSSGVVPLLAAPTPDLVPEVPVVSTSSAPANTRVTISWNERNDGDAATSGGYYTRIDLIRVSNGSTVLQQFPLFNTPASINPGETVARSQEIVLPASLTPGQYRVRVVTDHYGNINEYDREGNNTAQSVEFTVTEAIRADLGNVRITSELPAAPQFGSTLSLTYAVDNIGSGSTQNVRWNDSVRLVRISDGAVISTTNVTSGNTGTGVAAGGSYSNTVVLSLPLQAGTNSGDYRIEILTDTNNALNEADRSNNNGASAALAVAVPPLANLVVRDVTAPAAVTAGLEMDVSWVVDNIGDGGLYLRHGASYNYFHDRVYLADASGANLLRELGTFQVNGPFPADADPLARVQRITLPDTVVNGTYTIVVVTDYHNYIEEHNGESDNRAVSAQFTVTQPPRVDLQVDTVAVPPSAQAGSTLSLTWRTRNAGSADFVGGFREQVQISPVADFSSGVQTLSPAADFSGNLAAGASVERSATLTLPISVNGPNDVTRSWYVRVVTDTLNQVYEYDLENNNASTPGSTVITRPALPDLVVDSVDAPDAAVAGTEVVVTYTVTNNGSAEAGARTDRIRLNVESGSAWALVLDNVVDTPLAAGASQTLTARFTLPVNNGNTGFSGRLRAQVTTDVLGQVSEYPLDDNNSRLDLNQLVVSLPPLPNLTVGDIVVPLDALTETDIPLRWTISNSGAAAVTGGWTDYLYLSADGVIDASDRFVGAYNIEAQLAAGASIERVQTYTVPQDLVGTWRLLVRTDAAGQIFEGAGGENDNVGIDGQTLSTRLRPLPNLVVQTVTPPVNAFSGQEAVVSWTVGNVGTGATSVPVWRDAVYLSLDDVLDSADTLLATAANPGYLEVGGAYANSASFTLPRGIDGNYRFIVVTDVYREMFEGLAASAAETDNTSAPALARVTLTPPPDLQVSTVSAPPQAFSGEPVTVNWTVINDGDGRTREASWSDRIYLSTDDSLDGADTVLATIAHNGALDAGEHYNGSASLQLPIGISGPFYFIVVSDIYSQVYEHTSENNNGRVEETPTEILLTPPPDLEITDAGFAATARAGTTYTVQLRVDNLGASDTPDRQSWWYDQLWLSLDDIVDGSDLALGSLWHYGTVAADGGYNLSISGLLPAGMQGRYKLLARVDVDNRLFEGVAGSAGEANNFQLLGAVDVYQSRPDLVVSSFSMPDTVEAGRTATFSWTVGNQGDGDTITAGWSDSLWVSLDGTLGNGDDVLIGSVGHAGVLAPGGSYTVTVAPTLPFSLIGNGRFYVRTDGGAQVTESNETNNLSTPVLTPISRRDSDLVVSEAQVTPVAGDDRSFDLRYVVTNTGEAATHLNAWSDGIWLSSDGVIGAGDTRVKTVFRGNPLAAGEHYVVTQRITVPADVPEGSFKVLVRADEDNAVIEASDANNVAQAEVRIGGLPAPDGELPIGGLEVLTPEFTVTAVDAPEAAFSGQQVTLRWTVRNDGDAAQNPYWWYGAYDQVFLSSDPFLDNGDLSLGFAGWNNQAGGGNEVERSLQVTLPVGRAGAFYVLVKADAGNHFAESNDANNTAFDPALLDITLAPPADLVAGSISLPANAQPGQAMAITYRVDNASSNAALGAWRDTLYLSKDDVLDTGDVVFGSVDVYGPVAGGTFYTRTVNATVPGVDPGEYKLIVRSDVRNVLVEASEANNLSASVDAVTLDLPELQLGVPTTGTLGAGQSLFFKVTVGAGEALRFTLDGPGDDVAHDLWVGHNSVPSRSRNDVGSGEQYTPDPVLTVPTTEAGTYYVRIDASAFVSGAYSLRADLVPFSVEAVDEDTVGNRGEATVRVDGARFDADTQFELVATDGTVYRAVEVNLRDAGRAYVTFDLYGAEVGQYDLRALRTDAATGATVQAVLAASVAVVEGVGADAFLTINGPTAVQVNRDASFQLNYSNDGDADTMAPLIIVTPSNGTQVGMSSKSLGSEPLFILGTSLDGPLDLLRPGARYSLPVAYKAPGETGFLSIEARPVQSDSTEAITDWAAIERALRPTGVNLPAWQSFWARVQPAIGSTLGDLVQVLNDMAVRLSPAGDPVRDVRQLFALQLAADPDWLPTRAVAGQLLSSDDGTAVAGATVQLVAQRGDTWQVVGSAVTAADGSFGISGVRAGNYYWALGSGQFDMDRDGAADTVLTPLSVAANAAVPSSTLYLLPSSYDDAVDRQDSNAQLLVDSSGVVHMMWTRGDLLYHAWRDASGEWVDARPISERAGSNLAVAAGATLVGGEPGLIAVWEEGVGNDTQVFAAVAVAAEGGGYVWSRPTQITDEDVGSYAPSVEINGLGQAVVTFLRRDFDIQDDPDQYHALIEIDPNALVWSDIDGYLGTPAAQAAFDAAEIEPLGTTKISVGYPSKDFGPYEIAGFSFNASFEGTISSTLDDAACTVTDALTGKASLAFRVPEIGRAVFEGQASGNANWSVDPNTQDWKFGGAQIDAAASGKLEVKDGIFKVLQAIPATAPVALSLRKAMNFISNKTGGAVKLENTVILGPFGFEAKDLRWSTNAPFPAFIWPDSIGEFSIGGEIGLAAKAVVKSWDAELSLEGRVGLKAKLYPSFQLDANYTVSLQGKVAGWVLINGEWSDSGNIVGGSSLESASGAANPEDADDLIFVWDPAATLGTTNVYGSGAIDSGVAGNRVGDSSLELARGNDGTVYGLFARDGDAVAGEIGNRIMVTSLAGGGWGSATAIDGTLGFNSEGELAVLADGSRLALWSHASTDGLTTASAIDDVMAARKQSDLYFSIDTGSGFSPAVRLTDAVGSDGDVAIAKGADGSIAIAWVNDNGGEQVLYSARWNGTGFDAPTEVARTTGGTLSNVTIALSGGQTLLAWNLDSDAADDANALSLQFATLDGATAEVGEFETAAMDPAFEKLLVTPAPVDTGTGLDSASLMPLAGWPLFAVPEDCKQCTPEKLKKITEAAPDCRPGGGSSTTLDSKKCIEKTITYAPCVTRPSDPNDIVGPDGYGEEKWVKASEALEYTIRFENQASATAPAQVVTITQTLDEDLDARSFRVTGFGFADLRIDPAQSRASYSGRLDLRESQGIYLDVTANIDTATRLITWTFTTIDPATGDVPVDANLGFLLPNDDTGRGDGFVSYTVKPLRAADTGTVIDAQARIVFDTEAPIDTPAIFNTLDVGLPSSQVEALPETTSESTFTVRWGGTDAEGGSAIRDYEVYVSTDGGEWTLWQLATSDTEAVFEGEGGHVYAFYSVARDNAGNVEAAPATADATIRVLAQTGSVSGIVFGDIDADGSQDEGEAAAEGWTVFVDADADGTLDEGELSVVTAADGAWSFAELQPGDWRIAIQPRSGFEVTSPLAGYHDVAVTAGGAVSGRNFGTLALGSIAGAQFNDVNGNGQREAGEDGLAGWTVFIDADGDGLLDAGERSTLTAADGSYAFDGLRAGTYQVAVVTPEGWIQTRPGTSAAGQASTATVVTLAGSLASISLPACACGGTVTTLAAQQAGWDEQLVELDQLRADPGYAGVDGSGIRVVVIDTGIDASHPFFDGRVVYQYDFADNDAQAIDRNGHGTHVAGVIAGADAMFGGVAQGAELIVLKVFGDDGSGSFANLERALQWVNANAAAWNIGVVNLSLGDGSNWDNAGSRYGLGDEFASLAAKNIITVAAAGNNYASVNALGVAYPAADPAVLAVGAVWTGDFGGPWSFGNGGTDHVTGLDHIASFSQRDDDQVDIFAPGARLTSAAIGGGVRTMQGTSQSAAYVSGVAALAQQLAHQHLGRSLTVGEFHELLASTAVSINDGDDERDNVNNTGLNYGRLDVKALADAIVAMSGGSTGGGQPGGGDEGGDGDTPTLPAAGGGAITVELGVGEAETGADFGAFQLGRVSGMVWDDRDADGLRDADEAGIAGATVFVDANANGSLDDGETTVTTDEHGHWSLTSLRAGTLSVVEQLPAGWARAGAPASHSISVTSGLDRSDLDFGRHDIAPEAQDDSASVVAGQTVAGNVLDNDSDPGRADKSLLVVTLVEGPAHGGLVLGEDGSFSYTPAAGYEGGDSFRYAVSDGVSSREATVQIVVRHQMLTVVGFSGGHDGFTVQFSRPLASDGLDLGGADGDIVVTDAAGQVVAGSLFVAADGLSARFLASGSLLADGVYGVRLRAGAAALHDQAGVALDGDANGTGGDDWLGSFSVARGAALSVGLADTARGPGQVLGVAIADTGLAVRLSNGAGVTSVRFTLAYNPALLGLATVARGAGLPAGASFSATALGSGLIAVEISAAGGLPAGALTLAQLVATVPSGASYGAAAVIDVRELQVNGGALAALDDDAVHVAAYAGDVSRDRQHSTADVSLMRQLLSGVINRLPGWALVDGRIIGDVNGSGAFDAVDPLRLEQALAGMPGVTVPIPGAPVVTPPVPPVIRITVPPRVLPPVITPKLSSTPLSTVTPLVTPSATISANSSIRVTL
ncbi:MAG: S8 family serine peptidase [Burkholderiaceae bacterium]|nr:S8 family serine peptidase [Burkholderiaceae bacterium]